MKWTQLMGLMAGVCAGALAAQEEDEAATRPEADAIQTLPGLVVEGAGEPGFVPVDSTTATKTSTPIFETPASITVIGEEIIRTQQPRDLPELLRNVAGVNESTSRRGFDDLVIRGFSSSENVFVDGLRLNTTYVKTEPYSAERVEVLKGPASILFGQAAPGGLVNVVSKRPQNVFHADAGMTVGSWDLLEFRGDVGGPITEDGKWLYRLNGLVRERDDFTDFVRDDRIQLSPSFTWQPHEDTTVTLLLQTTHDEWVRNSGLPASGTILPNPNGSIRRELFTGVPGEDETQLHHYKAQLSFEHRINETWTVRNNTRYQYADIAQLATFNNAAPLVNDRLLTRFRLQTEILQHEFQTDTHAEARFRTGPAEHTLLVGADFLRVEAEQLNHFLFLAGGGPFGFDVFNPTYGAPRPTNVNFDDDRHTTQAGVYLQDSIKMWDRLTVLLGGRFDEARFTSVDSSDPLAPAREAYEDRAFTGRAGLIYEVVPGVAPYVSYTESFLPRNQVSIAGGPSLDPEEGNQWELGVKFDALDGRWLTTVAAYQLDRENLPVEEPPMSGILTQIGLQRAQGIEVESALELSEGLRAWFAYAYQQTEVKDAGTAATDVGNALAEAPEHSGSVWVTYDFQHERLEGFGVGFGLRYVGDRFADVGNQFELPSYITADAAVFYQKAGFRAQVNVRNVFDEEYFVGGGGRNTIYPGEPLNVMASVGYEF